jgi:type II secretory pathway component PulF
MNTFECKLAREDGTRIDLRRQAASREVLIRDLNAEGYLILSIAAAQTSSQGSRGRLRPQLVLKFTEILTTLMGNGLSLKEALALARPLGGKPLAGFLEGLYQKVQKGQSLHSALETGPRGFSPLYLGLVRIGEQTGDLAVILPRLVEYLRSRHALRQKTINALIYPGFVLSVALIGIALLSIFVLPVLTGAIGGVNPDAAGQYQKNVAGFQVLAVFLFAGILGVAVAVIILVGAARNNPEVAARIDRMILKIPFVRDLVWQTFGLHVSFAMEILLTSGFSVEVSLQECEAIIGNRAVGLLWTRVRDRVIKGMPLSRSLREEQGFPETFMGWVEVGEASHDLKQSFRQLRDFYQNQVDVLSTRFTSLVEPALIVVVGGLMITLVLTFVTPIFTMLGRVY